MINELRTLGIASDRVLDAMNRVPRHAFLDSALEQFAYLNQAFPIGAGQTISKPFTVARQTELLGLDAPGKVLEIGTGSGYQCAVLCALGHKVYSIERQRALFETVGSVLRGLGYKPELFYGDGYKGKSVFAPFDGIVVTCGAPSVPQALLGQLAIGGRLVIPVGEGDTQQMLTVERRGPQEFHSSEHGEFSFVPMLADRAPNPG
jgi:protein-L-isoaspartate(D-aspartate) O-methyltransferase